MDLTQCMPAQIISFACIFFNLNKYALYVKIAEITLLDSCGKYNLCTSVDGLAYADKMYMHVTNECVEISKSVCVV